MKRIRFHPAARAELRAAMRFYEAQRKGLGGDFLDEVNSSVRRVQELPESYPVFGVADVRKCVVNRFPYLVLYEERPRTIYVIAVAHGKRAPGYWRDRV